MPSRWSLSTMWTIISFLYASQQLNAWNLSHWLICSSIHLIGFFAYWYCANGYFDFSINIISIKFSSKIQLRLWRIFIIAIRWEISQTVQRKWSIVWLSILWRNNKKKKKTLNVCINNDMASFQFLIVSFSSSSLLLLCLKYSILSSSSIIFSTPLFLGMHAYTHTYTHLVSQCYYFNLIPSNLILVFYFSSIFISISFLFENFSV